jgi:hypothetical protein
MTGSDQILSVARPRLQSTTTATQHFLSDFTWLFLSMKYSLSSVLVVLLAWRRFCFFLLVLEGKATKSVKVGQINCFSLASATTTKKRTTTKSVSWVHPCRFQRALIAFFTYSSKGLMHCSDGPLGAGLFFIRSFALGLASSHLALPPSSFFNLVVYSSYSLLELQGPPVSELQQLLGAETRK